MPCALPAAVVVGADRVAANGDTANKIGTFQLAVAARHHRVPFYVAAPSSSCDPALPSGAQIPIEERPGRELTHLQGLCLAPPGACPIGSSWARGGACMGARGTHRGQGVLYGMERPRMEQRVPYRAGGSHMGLEGSQMG